MSESNSREKLLGEGNHSITEEIKKPLVWGTFLVAIILISVSANLELSLQVKATYLSAEDQISHLSSPWYDNMHVLASFLRELGFACVIAIIVGLIVERASRVQYLNSAKGILGLVSDDVFNAVLGVQTPKEIVKHTVSTILSSKIVRQAHRITFTLRELPNKPECLPYKDSHISVIVESDYLLENLTGSDILHEVKLMFPLPAVSDLKNIAHIESISIRDQGLTNEQIKTGEQRVPDTDYEICALWPETITPDKPLHVTTRTHLIKETSDNEVWSSLVPTKDLEVVVDVQIDGIQWNINSLHSGNMKPIDGPKDGPRGRGKVTFRSHNPILPNQGISVWWRPSPE